MIEINIDIKTLLRIGVYVAAYLGLIHLIVDIWAFHNSLSIIWGDFFNDLFTTGIAVTLLLGLRAIVESLSEDGPTQASSPRTLAEALDRPAFLFRIGMYFVPLVGMAHLVINVLGNRNNAPSAIWAGLFFSAFSVCAVIGFLVAVKAVVDWFVSRGAAVSGEATESDDWRRQVAQILDNRTASLLELINIVALLGLMFTLAQLLAFSNMGPSVIWAAITGGLFLTTAVVGLLTAARTIVRNLYERGDSFDQPVSFGIERLAGLEKRLNDPSEFLRLATYVIAYLGAANLVLMVLALRNASNAAMWSFLFVNLFTIAAAVSFMIGAKAVADWTIRQRSLGEIGVDTVRDGITELFQRYVQPRIAGGDDSSQARTRLLDTLTNARAFIYAGIFVVGALGVLYVIADLISMGQGTSFARYLHAFITNLSQVGAGVAALIVLVVILDSLRAGHHETDEWKRSDVS